MTLIAFRLRSTSIKWPKNTHAIRPHTSHVLSTNCTSLPPFLIESVCSADRTVTLSFVIHPYDPSERALLGPHLLSRYFIIKLYTHCTCAGSSSSWRIQISDDVLHKSPRIVFHNRTDVGKRFPAPSRSAGSHKALNVHRVRYHRLEKLLNRVTRMWSRRQIPISIVMITAGKSMEGCQVYKREIGHLTGRQIHDAATTKSASSLVIFRASSNSNFFFSFFVSCNSKWIGNYTSVVVVVKCHLILHETKFLSVLHFDSLLVFCFLCS